MTRTSSETICYVQQEKIGHPDPTAPDYVGTYTPPGAYKVREGALKRALGKRDNRSNPLLKPHKQS